MHAVDEAGALVVFLAAAVLMVVAASAFAWPVRPRGTPATTAQVPWVEKAAVALVLPTAAFVLYTHWGDPGALGDARADLSAQLRALGTSGTGEFSARVHAELVDHLRRQPADARARVMKARLDMQAGRYAEAATAYRQALEGPSKAGRDATLWVEYAEARGLLQGGRLAGEPHALVERALALDPDHPRALDLAGSAAWEQHDFAAAARHWRRLLGLLTDDPARRGELGAAIERAEQRTRFALPSQR